MDIPTLVRDLSLALVPFILSLTVHEYSHAWVAHRLGDPTAKDLGRLTLNPGAHIDPIGTLLMPVIGVVTGGMGFLAWAKPVPCRPDKFRRGVNPRFGMALVSAAGPLSNVVLALLSVGILAILVHTHVNVARTVNGVMELTPVALLLKTMFLSNVALAVFNMLPFPPLDGHRLLPPLFDPIIEPLSKYGFGILMVLLLFVPPVRAAIGTSIDFVSQLMLALVGLR